MFNLLDADYQICKLLIKYTDLESKIQATTQVYIQSGNMGDELRILHKDSEQLKKEVERIYADTYGIVESFVNLRTQYAEAVNYVRNGEIEKKGKL